MQQLEAIERPMGQRVQKRRLQRLAPSCEGQPAASQRRRGFLGKRRVAAIFLFFIGLSILLYPHIAQYVNQLHATRLVAAYFDTGAQFGGPATPGATGGGGAGPYAAGQNPEGSDEDIFGSIYIPKLKLELPIYTGSTTANLAKGIAHLEGTSLPVGGESTHSVLCGHNGAVTNEWFTHIDELTEGDLFYIRTLEQLLTYKVVSMKVIDPDDTSDLLIEPGRDLVTLLTCADSGRMRLIVTGERVYDTSWTGGVGP